MSDVLGPTPRQGSLDTTILDGQNMNVTELHHGNSAQVLGRLAADSIDLTVTSPPYDNLRTYNGFTFDFQRIAQELYRVTKPGGVLVWVVGDATVKGSETGTSFRQALHFKDVCGFNLHDTMIYQKQNPGGARGSAYGYWQAFEYMFVLSKGRPSAFSPIEDRRNAKAGQTGKFGGRRNVDGTLEASKTMTSAEFGRRFNIWSYPRGDGGAHPAIFPEALARDHILSWSNPGDLVLDPFMGSGTTGRMALQHGRRFVGIEISEEYLSIARQRIAAVQAANDNAPNPAESPENS